MAERIGAIVAIGCRIARAADTEGIKEKKKGSCHGLIRSQPAASAAGKMRLKAKSDRCETRIVQIVIRPIACYALGLRLREAV